MKTFYGKTYGINILSALKERFILCGRELMVLLGAFRKRPALLPALLTVTCSWVCWKFESFWPAVVMILFVAGASWHLMLESHKSRLFMNPDGKGLSSSSIIFTGIMLCLVLGFIGITVSSRMNDSVVESDCYNCTVTSVSYDLSGSCDMTVRLEGGAYVKANFYNGYPDADPGDSLLLYGKLREPDNAGNPGEFDYREYLKTKGIRYVINIERFETVSKAGFPLNVSAFLQRFFFSLRNDSIDSVSASFDGNLRALAAALCVGDKSLVSDEIKRDFRMSCCSHLLAVSGTHFSGFLAGLPLVLNALKIKRRKALVIYAVFAVLIGFLTGWGDSVTRAAFVSICFFAGRDWLSALSVASIVMTAADPFSPLSTGFQMSFCACIAIKVFSDKITDCFVKKLHFGEKAAGLISPCLAAEMGMIPFWSDISMRPDPEHVLIQITGSFAAQTACTFFIPCVFLCYLFPFWSQNLSMPFMLCLKLLLRIVSFGSLISERGTAPIRLGNALLLTAFIVLFLVFLQPCFVKRVFLKVFALILAFLVGTEVFAYINRPDCTVVFADVGQGDCCLIMTSEHVCLIDAGTYEEGASTVSNLLDYYGVRQVDYCFMSHWDVDHAGGIAALWESGRTKSILTAFVPAEGSNDKDVLEFFKSLGYSESEAQLFIASLELVTAGDRIDLSGNVYLDVLYPLAAGSGGNEDSIVAMLHILGDEDTAVLFTGDIGFSTEEILIGAGIDLNCDILKVAHHGSKYSTSDIFIEACSPELAVISVGRNNFYGHPTPETLDRLESYGCGVFRTDEEGAVIVGN
ncbi:MAG: ComEC/Rec2 family competence protein [Saccharofermentans sp.]|nr:ComEC/Rec2 family competence protein [Saccharofermentans sp.]